MSSAGVPEPGMPRTARCSTRNVLVQRREGGQHGFAQAALRIVVLDDDDAASRLARRRGQALRVQRLDRVEVDDPRRHAPLAEPLRGLQAGVDA